MHNTTNKMKKSQLRKIVQEAIQEILSEVDTQVNVAANKSAQNKALEAKREQLKALQQEKARLSKPTSAQEQPSQKTQLDAVNKEIVRISDEIKKLSTPGLSPLDLEEMANVAIRYELAPDAAAADFTGKKARIIAAMQATEEPMSKIEVAAAMGYDKQNPINADFMSLVADGAIIPSGEQKAPRMNRPAVEPKVGGEEEVGGEEGYEDIVAGDLSDEEIEASFAKAKRAGEEEPEAGEIETADRATGRMSDEDYEAFMQYSDLKNRLANVKSDILKAKRSRGTAGDISDRPSNEVERLRDLKDRLQKKINDLVASSEYLKKSQAKATDKPIEEPEADEEEQLDEWTISRMQYYAGIKK